MMTGVIRREELIRALQTLGGEPRGQGGETIISFPGTKIIVGRHDFSRAMLRRVERKLSRAGITPSDLYRQLRCHGSQAVKAATNRTR